MKKFSIKLTSIILSVAIVLVSLPLTIFATSVKENQTSDSSAQSNTNGIGGVNLYTYELVDRRDEYTKHFQNPNGTVTAIQYSVPLHTLCDDGTWENIDNTIALSGNEYVTADARIKFAKKTTGNETLLALHDGNGKITMSLDGANKKVEGEITNYSADENAEDIIKMSHLEKLNSSIIYRGILDGVDLEYVTVSNSIKENIILNSKLDSYVFTFTMKLNNMTAVQDSDGGISVYDTEEELAYRIAPPFMYDANGVLSYAVSYTLSQCSNNEYKITVTADKQWIDAPERVFPVTIDPSVSPADSTVVDLFVDSAQPTTNFNDSLLLLADNTSSIYWKTSALPNIPEFSYLTNVTLSLFQANAGEAYIGAYRVTGDWSDTLVYNDVSSGTFGSVDSTVVDYQKTNSSVSDSSILTLVWDITDVASKWYDGTYANYGVCLKKVSGTYLDPDDFVSFRSSEHSDITTRARLIVTYKDQFGLEDYWTYTSHSAGTAGNGYINVATGNLVLNTGAMTTTDSLMPYTASAIYNSALAGKYFTRSNKNLPNGYSVLGLGFKSSINQSIVPRTRINAEGVQETYYIYSDVDGTEHAFYQSQKEGESNIYYDENGLQLKLTVEETSFVIEDPSFNKYTFSKKDAADSYSSAGGFLKSITDVNGNTVNITTDEYAKPKYVGITPNGGSAITHFKLTNNGGGVLRYCLNSTSQQAVLFYYSNTYNGALGSSAYKFLRKIVYAHQSGSTSSSNWSSFYSSGSNSYITADAVCYYDYDASGRLVSVKDDLHKIEIRYGYDSAGRVTSVSEYGGANATLGQTVTYTYDTGHTEVRTSGSDDIIGNSDDIITIYTFDNEGRCKSTYSTDVGRTKIYGAVSGEYETQEKVKNNLKNSTTVGGSSSNGILNGGFERVDDEGKLEFWTQTSNVDRVETLTFGSHGLYRGRLRVTANTNASIYQYVFLPAGDYTLSMLLDTTDADNASVSLSAISQNDSEYEFKESLPSNRHFTSLTASEMTTQITARNISGGGERFKILITAEGETDLSGTASVYLDNIALEKGLTSNPYSFVEHGNFDNFTVDENGSSVASANDFWDAASGSSVVTNNYSDSYGTVAYVAGTIDEENYIKQRIYPSGNTYPDRYTNDESVFVIAGFAKAIGTVASKDAKFRLRVDVKYVSENAPTPFCLDFEKNSDDWQFVCGTFHTLSGDVLEYVDVYCEYSYQPGGYALFDNISVFYSSNNEVEQSTYYDSSYPTKEGLLRLKESGNYYEVYEYNDNRKLTRVANNRGEIHDYIYDENGINIESEIYYTFTNSNGLGLYPVRDDADSRITKIPQTRTDYTYNTYGLLTYTDTYEVEYNSSKAVVAKAGAKHIKSSRTYNLGSSSKIFGSLASETDSRGIETRYYYNSKTGYLLATINRTEGTGTAYTYDVLGNITSVMPATFTSETSYSSISTAEKVNYTYDSVKLLDTIVTQSSTYSFNYDVFGNTTDISVGSRELASYTYNANNGKLATLTYGNGTTVRYVYDELDNVKEIWYTVGGVETKAYEYIYTSYGQLARFDNLITGKTTLYRYDGARRLITTVEYDTADKKNDFSVNLEYNENSQLHDLYYVLNYAQGASSAENMTSYVYFYTPEGDLSRVSVGASVNDFFVDGDIEYSYDTFKRLTGKTYSFGSYTNSVSYGYKAGSESNSTTALVNTYTSTVNGTTVTYNYTYDNNGNITKITRSDGIEYRYVYDDLGQLIREDNTKNSATYVYTYDNAGNILTKSTYALTAAGTTPTSPTGTVNYGYNDASWGDLLTSYNGRTITYDEIGNPLSYFNGNIYTFTWSQGRRLNSASKSGGAATYYTYDANGIRTSKTVSGMQHTYYLNGSQIVAEEFDGNLFIYMYDADGSPIGMQYRNTSYADGAFDVYWYEKNLQGDVVALYDNSGNKLVEYEYNAWGLCNVVYYSSVTLPIFFNPFRYRGYYYDYDTGFYYLNSRYYDPKTGRFLTMDDPGFLTVTPLSLSDKNLYSYCDNNPIMRADNGGQFWETFFDVISLGASVVEVCVNPADPWAWAGLIGDAVDLIPFVTGVGEVTRAVKTTVKIVDKADDVVDAAKHIYRTADAASDIRKATGSYEILYKSGKNYIGKGGFDRAINSAVRNAKKHGDEVTSIMWKSAPNSRAAFVDEYLMQKRFGGVLSSDKGLLTYNKIWSPGKGYYGN